MSRRWTPIPCAGAEPLSLLHRDCFPEEPWDAPAFAGLLSLPGAFGWIAWQGREPIGFALALDLGGECEIISVGVVPARRGAGAGTALIERVLAEARERGAASVVLEVAVDNAAGRRLYCRCGFAPVGRRRGYYAGGAGAVDALVMRRVLASAA